MIFNQITLLNYSRPARERLESRKHCGPYTWQPAKPGTGRGFYQAQCGLFCDPRGSTFDLRLSEANDFIATRLKYTSGYFCDMEGEGDTLMPIVARLPRNRGFLAGWTMGEGMCASLDAEIYHTPQAAAFAAHSLAEQDAEKNREAAEADAEGV